MTKEQKKEIEEFTKHEWEYWKRLDPIDPESNTEASVYAYLSGRYPNMRMKTAYETVHNIVKALYFGEN